MDPDERLTAELGDQLRRATAPLRLTPERRLRLRSDLLAARQPTARSWWERWAGFGRRPQVWAPVLAALVALAVTVPLLTAHPGSGGAAGTGTHLAVVPPQGSAARAPSGAARAPEACGTSAIKVSVRPATKHLRPGQAYQFQVVVQGSSCTPVAKASGPVPPGLDLVPATSVAGSGQHTYQLNWTGRAAGGAGTSSDRPLSDGDYRVVVEVPESGARAELLITVGS